MLKLKSCPKCRMGDVVVDTDHYGWHEYCIQCGHTRDLTGKADFGQKRYPGTVERVSKVGTVRERR